MLVQKIKLDEQSAKLCTFNTSNGPYIRGYYLGCHLNSQDIFLRVISKDTKGVEVVTDDILVREKTKQQQDSRLAQVLERASL